MLNIGIVGYGNLGRAVELAARSLGDVCVRTVFSRRSERIKTIGAVALPTESIESLGRDLDCLILAGGSSSDLPRQAPLYVRYCNIVDSFDAHGKIAEHITSVNEAAQAAKHTAVVAAGWDPGFLSLIRLYSTAFMPYAAVNTLWGEGISQGHSEALRRIKGVIDAVQFTRPVDNAEELCSASGELSPTVTHRRICYIAAVKGEEVRIAEEVKGTEDYFKGYETHVVFTDREAVAKKRAEMHHRGRVIAEGETGIAGEHKEVMRLELQLSSNPEFTAFILIAAARAASSLSGIGCYGAKSFFDIPPRLFLGEIPEGML